MKNDNAKPEGQWVVDYRTTRTDKNKNQITNIIYDQNSTSTIKKIITKPN